jgi:hypothetical protein
MATNTLLTVDKITQSALAVLNEELTLGNNVTRKFDKDFGKTPQIGDTLRIRKPAKYTVSSTADITSDIQNSVEDYVNLSVNQRRVVPISFTSKEMTMNVNDFEAQFVRPAMQRLAREIDIVGYNALKVAGTRIPRATLTNGVAFADILKMNAQLDVGLQPSGERKLALDAYNHIDLVNELKGLFQSSQDISLQYQKGYMGTAAGFDFLRAESIPSYTIGTADGAGTVNDGSIAEGDTTIVLANLGTGTIPAGSSVTFAGVYEIDPQTQASTGRLKQWIVASTATIAANAATITLSEPFYTVTTSRTVANCSALPVDGAVVTINEVNASALSGRIGFGWHPSAIALGMVDLEVPRGTNMAHADSLDGLKLRVVSDYNVLTDTFVTRIDCQFGWAVLRPEGVVSVVGKLA